MNRQAVNWTRLYLIIEFKFFYQVSRKLNNLSDLTKFLSVELIKKTNKTDVNW